MAGQWQGIIKRFGEDEIVFLESVRGEGRVWVVLVKKQLRHILERHQNPELVKTWRPEDGPIPSQFDPDYSQEQIVVLLRDAVVNCKVQF